MRKGIGKESQSLCEYAIYLDFTSQEQGNLSVVGNSASTLDAQQVFNSTFSALINKDYYISVDIDKYLNVLEHALSKVDFLIGAAIFMLPSSVKLNIGNTVGQYTTIKFDKNLDRKTGSNRNIYKSKVYDQKPLTSDNFNINKKKNAIPSKYTLVSDIPLKTRCVYFEMFTISSSEYK